MSRPGVIGRKAGRSEMIDGQRRLARALAYAGVLPPWLGLALHFAAPHAWAGFATVAYAAIIVSFVCGMHWGVSLSAPVPPPINLLLTSNAGALFAWAMVPASFWSRPLACIGLAIALGLLLVVDRRLMLATVLEPWFWRVRRNASIGLGAALVIWSLVA